MKLLKRMLALAIFLALAPNPAEAEPPNLIGRWQGEATVLLQFKTETVQTSQMQILEITHHDGQMIRGLHLWAALEDGIYGNVAGEHVVEASEPVIGVVGQDGKTIRMVEIDDPGMLFATVLGPNELEVEYLEAGETAVVWNAILRRVSE